MHIVAPHCPRSLYPGYPVVPYENHRFLNFLTPKTPSLFRNPRYPGQTFWILVIRDSGVRLYIMAWVITGPLTLPRSLKSFSHFVSINLHRQT